MAYRLHYFPIRGRGEQVRLLFHALEIPFDDVRVDRTGFGDLRAAGPGRLAFGSLPMLEDDGFFLVQGPAILAYLGTKHGARSSDLRQAARCDALTLGAEDLRIRYFRAFSDDDAKKAEFVGGDWAQRWLPRLDSLLALNESDRHFVGTTLSVADVALWDVLDAMTTFIPGATLAGQHRLQAFSQAFAARPPVAAYLAARPKN
jgi:glutathione S-transferase